MTDISDMEYKEFVAQDIGKLKPMYELRPNKSCDAAPLTCFVYKEEYKLSYYYEKDKRYLQQPSDRGVYINEPLVTELKKLLGENNVAVQ